MLLNTISNRDAQLAYFSDKVRLELNLNSLDRIRKYLGATVESLSSALSSQADPIKSFLCKAINFENTLDLLKHQTPKLRNLEHLLLLCLCDFNLSFLEQVVRDTTGKTSSITNYMTPYKILYEEVKRNKSQPENEVYFIELRDRIKWAVTKTLGTDCSYSNYSLLDLYTAQNRSCCDTQTNAEQSIFNISMPRLPEY